MNRSWLRLLDSITIINIPGSGNFFTGSTISPGFFISWLGSNYIIYLKILNSGNAWAGFNFHLLHRISVIAGGAQVAGAEF